MFYPDVRQVMLNMLNQNLNDNVDMELWSVQSRGINNGF